MMLVLVFAQTSPPSPRFGGREEREELVDKVGNRWKNTVSMSEQLQTIEDLIHEAVAAYKQKTGYARLATT